MIAKRLGRELPADRMLTVNAMTGLTPNERCVLAAIAYHDGPGTAYPSDKRIIEVTPLRYRGSVFDARKGLEKKGRLKWVNGQNTNIYAIAYGVPFVFDEPDASLSGERPDSEISAHCPGQPRQ